MNHPLIIQVSIAYTLLGAFVFTVIVTCLSLIGLVKFADRKQQNRLFIALILELVTGSVGLFFNFIRLDATHVADRIEEKAVAQMVTTSHRDAAQPTNPASVPTTFRVSPIGVSEYWIAVDDKKVEIVNGIGRISVSPGSHFLVWWATGAAGDSLAISALARETPILQVSQRIPFDRTTIEGSKKFTID